MYKKIIKYTDYNGVEHEDTFYFNYSKAELIEMDLVHPEGFEAWINGLIKASDNEALVNLFKELILGSYGEKDPTGKRFIKSKELSEGFSQTEAYSELYMELITNTESAIEFVNGIVPKVEAPAQSNVAALSEA